MPNSALGKKCFLAGPRSSEAGRVAEILHELGLSVTDSSSLPASPTSWSDALRYAIEQSDVVVVAIGSHSSTAGLFELGLALGLSKPAVVVAQPTTKLPMDVADVPLLSFDAIEDDPEEFLALLGRLVRPLQSRPRQRSVGRGLGDHADTLLVSLAAAQTEHDLVDIISDALTALGVAPIRESRLSGKGRVDLLVWDDDLNSLRANPLIIECKRSVGVHAGGAMLPQLEGYFRAARTRIGLLVYLQGPTPSVAPIGSTGASVLLVRADTLIEQLRSKSLSIAISELASAASTAPFEP